MITVQPISCLPPEEASVPLAVAMTPLPADTAETASVIPSSGSPISNAKRKIVVKLGSREKNPSLIDGSEVAMSDNTEASQSEPTNGTNVD